MAYESEWLNGAGLGEVWGKIKAQYLALAGGVLNNNATIGWKDSGGTSVANLIQYNTANEFILGYNQKTKGATRIFGKSIALCTNGETARLTIGEDGVATFASDVVLANTKRIGWVNSGGTTVSNLLQYTSDNKLYLGYGQSTVNDTNIYGKVVSIMTNGNTARVTVNSDGTTTLANKLTVSSGGLEVTGDSRYHDSVVLDNTKGLVFKNTSDGNVTALSLNSQNILVIGYGNASANQTQIFGKSIVLATNGANTRMTIGEDGNISVNNNLAVSGAISEGGTLISTKYTYTAGDSINITNNVVKVSMLESLSPTTDGNALAFIDTISQSTAGKITATKKNVQEASSSQAGVVSTSAQTFAGAKTFSDNMTLGGTLTVTGTTTMKNVLTIKREGGQTNTPLVLATSYGTNAENGKRCAIKFENKDGDSLGYIGCDVIDTVKKPYFNDGSRHVIWHNGIAGTSTTDWACKDLTANGDISMTGDLAVAGAISEGGTLISSKYTYTAGSYIGITSNAISVQEASASQGGVVTNDTQTIAGVKTFKTTSKSTPLIIQNGYTSTSNANHTSIQFLMNDGTSMGYLGLRKNGTIYEPYFYDSSYRTIWHSGNANLLTVSWKCLDLTANGDISAVGNISSVGNVTAEGNVVATGGVAAGGIIDMTLI